MASFRTHIQFAAVGSGVLSSLLLAAEVVNPFEAMSCALAGTVGGILPDIDSDNSHSLSIVFAVFSMVACALGVIFLLGKLPLLWIWGACLLLFLFLQFVVRPIFAAFTVHRGVFHSLLACLLFIFLVATLASYLGVSATASWLLGMFTGFGFCLHLLLDEIYSVDFMNVKVKRSFGSALKAWSYGDGTASLLMLCLTVVFFLLAPPIDGYIQLVLDENLFNRLVSGVTR